MSAYQDVLLTSLWSCVWYATQVPIKPIISSGFMTRGQVGTIHAYMLCAVAACPALISYSLVSMFSCQIDLIDKRHRPDNIYKWIGRYMNHWAIIHFLFQDPAFRQWSWICEYSQKCDESGPVKWSSSMGCPQNPKCQGVVEQNNHMVEKHLGVRLHEWWWRWLPTWSEWLSVKQCKYYHIYQMHQLADRVM